MLWNMEKDMKMATNNKLEMLQTLRNMVFFSMRLQETMDDFVRATGGTKEWPEAKQDQLSDLMFDKGAICKTLRQINEGVTMQDLEQFLPKGN